MIRFLNVSLMRGTKPLLQDVDLTLNPGDKIGLIGANGAGKSSLFGMLRNELHPDQGQIDFPAKWRMAYVAQETPALDRAALDYRAVVGREAILRFHVPQAGREPKLVNVKCKVTMRGALKRIKLDGVRAQGDELDAAKAAFAAAIHR